MEIHWPDGRRLVFRVPVEASFLKALLSDSFAAFAGSLLSIPPLCGHAQIFDGLRAWYEKGCQKIRSAESIHFFFNAAALKSSYWVWEGDGFALWYKRLEKGTSNSCSR